MVMTAKLAFKNLSKSFKDYTVYFLTIAFGVCLFYVFNSLDSQEIMIKLNDDQRSYFEVLVIMISGLSIFVSVILAFLIIYANKFLIKRRKKELSVYMILGMEKRKISKIIVLETFFSGILAMLAGLAIGIFAAQGLSVVVANMFKAQVESFRFTFSLSAMIKTIIYFGLIFLIVIVFNVVNITRCRLITLIQSQSKNEVGKVKSFGLSMFLFILSCGCIGFAYNRILKNSFFGLDKNFYLAIGFGAVGTFLFFLSMSGFLLQIIKKNKRLYYKNLNMFTLRQFSNKVNTNCISMTIISIMLLITIGVLACAMSINRAMNINLEKYNPQDAMFYCSHSLVEREEDGTPHMSGNKLITEEFSNDHEIKEIVSDSTKVNVYMYDKEFKFLGTGFDSENMYYENMPIEIMPLSDYNNMMKMRGADILDLSEGEYAVMCNSNEVKKYYDLENMPDIALSGQKLKYNGEGLLDVQIFNFPYASTFSVLVVNDELIANEHLEGIYYLVNLKDYEKDNNKFKEVAEKYIEEAAKTGEYGSILAFTRQEAINMSSGLSVLATFLSLYIGIVFLITSCAVLALQQLSESTDNAFRYNLLRKIGASSKSLKQALFRQIGIYFILPLAVASVHAVVGIKAASKMLKIFGDFNIILPALGTAGIIILVYGGYFVATYFCSKNIIKK